MDELQLARQEINAADEEMARLFEKRMEAARKIAAYKKEHGLPVFDEVREKQVLESGVERVEDDELRGYYTEFLRDVMTVSKQFQSRLMEGMKISYCGAPGAFACLAAGKVFPDAKKIGFPSFKEAYAAVENGECDAAVLPLENSFAGEVGQVTDLLFSGSLFINGTTALSVSHDLLAARGTRLEDVTEVVSHPQALAQCSAFLKAHHLRETTFENTALAAQYVAEKHDPHLAAIASSASAEEYGLDILAQSIQDVQNNTTRFAILSRAENRNLAKRSGAHFVLMFTVRNEAGALARALNIIGAHGFNMRTLRSRPMKELLWQYYFYLEAEGNIHGNEGKCMLEELQVCCDRVKPVGTFTE